MLEDAVKGLTYAINAESTKADIKAGELRGALIAAVIGTAFATSKITRKRVEEGKQPVIGFF